MHFLTPFTTKVVSRNLCRYQLRVFLPSLNAKSISQLFTTILLAPWKAAPVSQSLCTSLRAVFKLLLPANQVPAVKAPSFQLTTKRCLLPATLVTSVLYTFLCITSVILILNSVLQVFTSCPCFFFFILLLSSSAARLFGTPSRHRRGRVRRGARGSEAQK